MQQLRCQSCGSSDFAEEEHFYVCKYCGSKIERTTKEEASTISSADSVNKLMERADLYWDLGKIDNARRLYKQILDIDATNEKALSRAGI